MKYLIYLFSIALLHGCQQTSRETRPLHDLNTINYIDNLNKQAWELRKKKPSESLQQAKSALLQSDKIGYSNGMGVAYKTLGALKVRQGLASEGIIDLKKAIEILTPEENTSVEIGSIYLLLGNASRDAGHSDEAVFNYYEGIRFADLGGDKLLKANISTMLAKVLVKQNRYEDADSIFQKAIKIQEDLGDSPKRMAVSYYNYGTFLSRIEKFGKANHQFKKAEDIFSVLNDDGNLARVYSGQANVYVQIGSFEKALLLHKKSLEIKRKKGDTRGMANSFNQIGYVLLEKGAFKAAEDSLMESLVRSKTLNMPDLRSKTFRALSDLNEKTTDYKTALSYYLKHISIRDSLVNKATQSSIAEIEEKYENEKLLRNMEQQTAVLIEQKFWIWGIGIALFSVVVIAFISINFLRQKRRNAQLLYEQKEEIHKQKLVTMSKEAELRAFNSLMDGQEIERKRIAETLHDSMGSFLSAIQLHFNSLSKHITNEQLKTKELWHKTSNLVQEASIYNRNLAYQMMPPVLIRFGLSVAIDHLADRISMPGVKVETNVYGLNNRLPEKIELILYRVMDELLNNIMKHAKASEIEIQLTAHDEELNVIVRDDGIGFNFNPLNPNYGMGLNNIHSRIKHFDGNVEIDSSPGKGTTVIINMPISNFKRLLETPI